jgi:hypothetical protein
MKPPDGHARDLKPSLAVPSLGLRAYRPLALIIPGKPRRWRLIRDLHRLCTKFYAGGRRRAGSNKNGKILNNLIFINELNG